MKNLHLLITIAKRSDEDEFIDFYQKNGISNVLATPCRGTAKQKTLDLLGIEPTEKVAMFAAVSNVTLKNLIKKLTYEMKIDLPDRGIAISVPLSSVGGTAALNLFLEGQQIDNDTEENMNSSFELIIAIAEKGRTEEVMDAARAAGASGGTIIHAKGTGDGSNEKFFGISIAQEKEMIFIVAKSSEKSAIMKSIMQNAGVQSKAHALLLSMPVSETAGFRIFDEDDK